MKDKPLFFLHIPRTAGTTVDHILMKKFPTESILKCYKLDEYKNNRFSNEESMVKIKYITGHLLLTKYNPPMFYDHEVNVFTFLRNPISRLISEYIFYKTWPNQHLYRYINDNNISFKAYIQSSDKILKYRGKNFMTRSISGIGFEYNKASLSALAVAKRNLDKNFFFFGITEKFTESILLLSKKIGIDIDFYEEHNKLNKKTKEEITDEDISMAQELNQTDIALYNFAIDLFNERINSEKFDFKEEMKIFQINNKKYQADIFNSNKNDINDQLIYLPKPN